MNYFKKLWPAYFLVAIVFVCSVLGTDRTVTTIAENLPVPRKSTVIIDPGHGGIDGGAMSCSGVPESQINLEIGIRLRDLCNLLGYSTVMTRSGDISIYTEGSSIAAKKASDLRNRVSIVNNIENGILISIHQNTFSDQRYSGAQVFFAETSGSEAFASCMQDLFIVTLNPGSNRREKPANNVYLMQHIRRTGILVECGFLSNPEEEAKLRSREYQMHICCVIASALSSYLNT